MAKRIVPAVVVLLVIFLGLSAWFLRPEVQTLQPAEGPLHGRQPLQITFSRPMLPASVENHLEITPSPDLELTWDESYQILTVLPLEPWPPGSTAVITVSSGALARIRLPLLSTKKLEIPVSPTLLAYLWPADDTSSLYVFNPETGESRALIDHPEEIQDFTVSPDGLTVYFSSFSRVGESIIYRYDRLTNASLPLINCGQAVCQNPALSPDGTRLLYEQIDLQPELDPGIFLHSLEDGHSEEIGPPGDHLTTPSWGPAGWFSYYNRSREAYHLINRSTGAQSTLPNQTGGSGTWSPAAPVFVTTEIFNLSDTLAPRHLLRYLPAEDALTNLTQDDFLEDANPVYSPSGSRLAFGRKSLDPARWTPGRQLWILEEDSGESFPLTAAVDYNHTGFNWDPTESRLAYVRYNQAKLSEAPEIWLIDLTSGGNYRLIINGFNPLWIP